MNSIHRPKSPGEKSILVILGPTASGKSALAVKLARKYGGEVISADSRQVYRGLNIGTCKITRREMMGIPHHLLNIASPLRSFSSATYERLAKQAIKKITAKNKLPIICGGTGHYIDMVLGAQSAPNVPPNPKLRAKLEKRSTEQLFAQLQKLDLRRAAEIDRHNPRRLIRALEIVLTTGKPVPKIAILKHSKILENVGMFGNNTKVIKLGLMPSPTELRKRINARLEKDIQRGLIAEVETLHANGLSWKRLNELGLEYRYVSRYLKNIKTNPSTIARDARAELVRKLKTEIWRYAKRQMQWFKRDKNIYWVKNEREALRSVQKLLR